MTVPLKTVLLIAPKSSLHTLKGFLAESYIPIKQLATIMKPNKRKQEITIRRSNIKWNEASGWRNDPNKNKQEEELVYDNDRPRPRNIGFSLNTWHKHCSCCRRQRDTTWDDESPLFKLHHRSFIHYCNFARIPYNMQ